MMRALAVFFEGGVFDRDTEARRSHRCRAAVAVIDEKGEGDLIRLRVARCGSEAENAAVTAADRAA